jgi:hypothetical protein
MRLRSVIQLLFIFYCLQVGSTLVIFPWNPAWDRLALEASAFLPGHLLLHPLPRALVTGFGLVHLVWGAHDLELFLLERARHHNLK